MEEKYKKNWRKLLFQKIILVSTYNGNWWPWPRTRATTDTHKIKISLNRGTTVVEGKWGRRNTIFHGHKLVLLPFSVFFLSYFFLSKFFLNLFLPARTHIKTERENLLCGSSRQSVFTPFLHFIFLSFPSSKNLHLWLPPLSFTTDKSLETGGDCDKSYSSTNIPFPTPPEVNIQISPRWPQHFFLQSHDILFDLKDNKSSFLQDIC